MNKVSEGNELSKGASTIGLVTSLVIGGAFVAAAVCVVGVQRHMQAAEEQSNFRQSFSQAGLDDQLNSIHRGFVHLSCTDKATGREYDVKSPANTQELSNLYGQGCKASAYVAGKAISLDAN